MKTLIDLFKTFDKRRGKTAFVYRTGIRRFTYSYKDLSDYSLQMASYLESYGIQKGDRVAIWAPNSPWWPISFFGITLRGAVVVPIDFASGRERASKIIEHSGAKLIIQSQYKLEKVHPSKSALAAFDAVFIEDLQFVLEKFSANASLPKILPKDLAEIVYTSGTTGDPKGVVLTHENLAANILQADNRIAITPSYKFLSVLPLSHMFEQMPGFLVPLYKGASIVYVRTIKPSAILEALKTEDIYVLIAVPRLLQALRNSIELGLSSKHLGTLFKTLLKAGEGRSAGFKKILFFPIHKKFGKNFKFFLSGGAALDPALAKFWQKLGFTAIEGYGLTETSPILIGNFRDHQVLGSIGKPLSGVKIKLVGREILAKGKNVFRGYWQNTKATREAFADGWFKTGDEAQQDTYGNFYIKGRKKDVIVTSAGINVYPDEIESVLSRTPGVKDACVVGFSSGEGEEVHAVLILEKGAVPEKVIERANEKLDPQQRITGFSLWHEPDFPKTPTLKVQKFRVLEVLKKGEKGSSRSFGDKLMNLIASVSGKKPSEIKENSLLASDLGITSIGRLELVNYIEQEFRTDLEDTAINQHTTVASLRKSIERRDKHDMPLQLAKYPYKSWAILISETMHKIWHYKFLSHYIKVDKVEGLENIKDLSHPVIFIANHVSYFDYGPIAISLPRYWREKTAVATREEYFSKEGHFLLRKIAKRIFLEYITLNFKVFLLPQKRGFRKALAFMGKLVDSGISILIFPEGERSRTSEMLPFMPGLGIVVKELQLPVVPIKIIGMDKIYPRGKSFPPKKGKVQVKFGKPIYFTTESPSEVVEKCREVLLKL